MCRRLSEDRNQHYDDLSCPCWWDGRAQARFKEQPKLLSCYCCSSPRRNPWLSIKERLTMAERRFLCEPVEYLPAEAI